MCMIVISIVLKLATRKSVDISMNMHKDWLVYEDAELLIESPHQFFNEPEQAHHSAAYFLHLVEVSAGFRKMMTAHDPA